MSVVRVRVPAKVVWLGEHFVHTTGAVASAVGRYLVVEAVPNADGPLIVVDDDALRSLLDVLLPPSSSLFPFLVRVVQNDIPAGVGLGSSSAKTVAAVALARCLSGHPLDRAAIAAVACELERRWSKASGVDATAVTYGGTIHYGANGAVLSTLAHFPRVAFVTPSGEPHTASCTESVRGEAKMRALLARATTGGEAPAAWLDEAHALMRTNGLSSPRVEATIEALGGAPAKVTGRGKGGCVLSCTRGEWALPVVDEGVVVEDHLHAAKIPHSLAVVTRRLFCDGASLRLALAFGKVGVGIAHPNIALVKYWGKEEWQMPSNASVSLALPYFVTRTRVRVVADDTMADRPSVTSFPDARVRDFVDAMLRDLLPPVGCRLDIKTANSFPSSCGVASSASGFCALVRALRQLGGAASEEALAFWTQQWARLGSGSAVRSVVPESGHGDRATGAALVSWKGANAHLHIEVHPSLRRLEHMLVVFDPLPKRRSSSSGHALAPTCPFHPMRVAHADGHVDDVVYAFARGDWETVRAVTEAEALTMHLVSYGCDPPVRYMDDASVAFVARFVRWRDERGAEAMYTVDAGANVHLLWKPEARAAVQGFVAAHKHMFVLFRGVPRFRYRVVLLSGKRFSGKTTLANALVAQRDGLQVLSLSTAIKAAYSASVGADGPSDVESREVKEAHRARMIAFAEAARADDPFHWCRVLWHAVAPWPTDVLVTDARRPSDVAFFRKCTQCTVVRVECPDAVRKKRGWSHDPVVDASPSETGLDDPLLHDVTVRGDDDVAVTTATLAHAFA